MQDVVNTFKRPEPTLKYNKYYEEGLERFVGVGGR